MTLLSPQGTPIESSRAAALNDLRITTALDLHAGVGRVRLTLLIGSTYRTLLEGIQQQLLAYKVAERTDAFDNLINAIGAALAVPESETLDLSPQESHMIGARLITSAEKAVSECIMTKMLMEMGNMPLPQAIQAIGEFSAPVRIHHQKVFLESQKATQAPVEEEPKPEPLSDDVNPNEPLM